MKWLANAAAVVLVLLALAAPLAANAHCDGEHEAQPTTECACVCCCDPAFACTAHVSCRTALTSQRTRVTGVFFSGRLSVADVFRPPISA
jgi:hypothetical protein